MTGTLQLLYSAAKMKVRAESRCLQRLQPPPMTAAHQLFLQRHGEDRDEDEQAPAEVGPVALRVEDDHLKEDKNNSKN